MTLLRAAVCGLLSLSASAWAQPRESSEHDSPSHGPVTDVGLMASATQVDEELLHRITLPPSEPSTHEAPSKERLDPVDFTDVMAQRSAPLLTLRFTTAGTTTSAATTGHPSPPPEARHAEPHPATPPESREPPATPPSTSSLSTH